MAFVACLLNTFCVLRCEFSSFIFLLTCEIMSEGHSAKRSPTLISSIFGRHIAVSFSESQEAINMFFFLSTLTLYCQVEKQASPSLLLAGTAWTERPVGKEQSISNPLHCRQQHVLTVKIVLYPLKKKEKKCSSLRENQGVRCNLISSPPPPPPPHHQGQNFIEISNVICSVNQ